VAGPAVSPRHDSPVAAHREVLSIVRPPVPLAVPARPRARHRVALIVEPRFSGGTGTAVAAEIRALGGHVDLSVVAIESGMFRGRDVNPKLQAALDACGLDLVWSPPVVRADTVVFHNPSCLKFGHGLSPRISCARAYLVTHENFLRPNGSEGFDVAGCLAQIDAALICGDRSLAPVSTLNRRGVEAWLARHGGRDWAVTGIDWINICDRPLVAPTASPRDRRGRHSRAGLEKFPPLATMLRHFPAHAERCAILGGDSYLADPATQPPHWEVLRFGAADVDEFLSRVDFFVYFTHPNWSESFGRAIVEAIAAGKLVITDTATAASFGGAVVGSDGHDVDAVIAGFVAEPQRYGAFVRQAQGQLARFGPDAFRREVLGRIVGQETVGDALP